MIAFFFLIPPAYIELNKIFIAFFPHEMMIGLRGILHADANEKKGGSNIFQRNIILPENIILSCLDTF